MVLFCINGELGKKGSRWPNSEFDEFLPWSMFAKL